MGAISIKYPKLKTAISDFRSAAKKLDKVSEELQDVLNKGRGIPGDDPQGNYSSAVSLVRQKISKANAEANCYRAYATHLEDFSEHAKAQDKNAANQISVVISNYVGKRSLLQKVGDFIHNTFVAFCDKMESLGPIGKFAAQCLRGLRDTLESALSKIKNWFKYGNGQYVLSILRSVGKVILAAASAAVAYAATITAAPVLAVIATVGAIAACVYCLMALGDAVVNITNDVKAIGYRNDGELTASRYYGNIDDVQTYTQRTDFGDASDNALAQAIGETYSLVRDTAKTTSEICSVVTTVGTKGLIEKSANVQTVDWKLGLKNTVKENVSKAFGKDATFFKSMTGGFDTKLQVFNQDGTVGLYKGMVKTFSTAKVLTTIDKTYTSGGDIIKFVSGEGDYSLGGIWKFAKNVNSVAGRINAYDAMTGDGSKVVEGSVDTITNIVDLFKYKTTMQSAGDNSYIQYLANH